MHSAQNVRFGRLAHRILLIIRQDDHILSRVSEILVEVTAHIFDVVDTSSQLTTLPEVIDADQERFSPSRAVTVLKTVALGSTGTEMLSS